MHTKMEQDHCHSDGSDIEVNVDESSSDLMDMVNRNCGGNDVGPSDFAWN